MLTSEMIDEQAEQHTDEENTLFTGKKTNQVEEKKKNPCLMI